MKTEIIAPFDGMIVDVPAKENDELSAVDYNSRTIVDLVDTSQIELNGYVDEKDVRNISTGQTANIYVDVVPDRKFTGEVAFVSPYGSLQTGPASFFVKIVLDPLDTLLQRGLSATVVIPVGKHSNVLLIPASAVRLTAGEYFADVLTDRSTSQVEQRKITLGLQNDDFAEVVSGLEENETVVLQGLSRNYQ
jgi:RND family efflux transporter MFP subunit